MTQSMNAILAPTWVTGFLMRPIYVLGALLALLIVVWLVKYLVYDLPKKAREKRETMPCKTPKRRKGGTTVTSNDPNATEEGARIAAAIAASIVAMEDAATVAAITAAVRMYLEAENEGKTLPSGFRVVSFRRRGGRWNR